jgi:hypothetical protein
VAVTFAFKSAQVSQTNFKVNDSVAIHIWLNPDRKITRIKLSSDDAAGALERSLGPPRNSRVCGSIQIEKQGGDAH